MMSPKLLLGKIAVFHLNPNEVKLGLPTESSKPLAGEIISMKQNPATIRGNIPDQLVTVRGRSGKEVVVSLTDNYVTLFSDWKSALTFIAYASLDQ